MNAGVEIEIKLAVTDRDDAARRLVEAGAEMVEARSFEDNWLFDHPDGRLKERRVMVRLRKGSGRARLTLKEPTGEESAYKVRREVETAVDDGEAVRALLEAIGLHVAYRYQKYRATYRAGDLLVTLDEVPIGTYIELEGSPDEIDRFAARLGFSRDHYINVSYRQLQRLKMQESGQHEEPVEMIFAGGSRR